MRIPKLRRGSFFPSILERRRRIDRALFAVVMDSYPTRIEVTDAELAAVPLRPHEWHPEWNYTILPVLPDALVIAAQGP